MKRQQDIEQQARQAEQKPALYGADIDFAEFYVWQNRVV